MLGEKHAELSACYVVLGNLKNDECDYRAAGEFYLKGLALAESNNEELDIGFNLYNLGDVATKSCDYKTAC